MARANRKYKDSVFCDVFYSDRDAKANLLSLYNALHDTSYTDVKMIEKVRLEDVLYNNMKNDIAFLVGECYIVLGEHQSTINENMPLRSLMYVAREYEKLVDISSRYRSRRIMLPRPEFFVFYNGTQDYPAEAELKLSNSFLKTTVEPQLELIVKVININPGKKNPLLENCQVMREYSRFVEETRRYKGDKDALKKAIESCIKEGILADYLKRKSGEVINMLMAEYDYDMDIAVQREEAAEEALERGIAQGRSEGLSEGLAQGRSEGLSEGLARGRSEGITQGRSEGLSEGLARGRSEGLSEGLAQGRSEGLSEGLAQGRSEGLAQGLTDGIRLMKKALELNEQGLSEAEIAKELKISIEQVRMMIE